MRDLVAKVLNGDLISDKDLLALYNNGFLALNEDEMPTDNVSCVLSI